MDGVEAQTPPLAPIGEQVAPSDPAFVKACLSSLDVIRGLGDIKAGPPRLTVNPTWAPVFRVDFTIDGRRVPGRVDRLMCWKQPNGVMVTNFAIGQDIPPLAPPRPLGLVRPSSDGKPVK
jgi:hypothetical protein